MSASSAPLRAKFLATLSDPLDNRARIKRGFSDDKSNVAGNDNEDLPEIRPQQQSSGTVVGDYSDLVGQYRRIFHVGIF